MPKDVKFAIIWVVCCVEHFVRNLINSGVHIAMKNKNKNFEKNDNFF